MICERCKQCWNYMVSEVGCYGNVKTCKYFRTDEGYEYLIAGIEDGWINTWYEYLEAKKMLDI